MIDLRAPNREMWLWLFRDGGAWTAYDLARQRGRGDIDAVFDQLSGMARRGLLEKFQPMPGSRRLRYAVTGTCLVPHGLHLAEVQLEEPVEAPQCRTLRRMTIAGAIRQEADSLGAH